MLRVISASNGRVIEDDGIKPHVRAYSRGYECGVVDVVGGTT